MATVLGLKEEEKKKDLPSSVFTAVASVPVLSLLSHSERYKWI
jgi:hypothetical protein